MAALLLRRLQFTFQALEEITFPSGLLGNSIRGALGSILRSFACPSECPGPRTCARAGCCTYARVFEPSVSPGPSGMADPPRPFVIRAAHLHSARFAPGETFTFTLNLFDPSAALWPELAMTFAHLAKSGLGTDRRRILLTRGAVIDSVGAPVCVFYEGGTHRNPPVVEPETIRLEAIPARRIRVRFVTPFELKGLAQPDRPDFHTVFARARDRCATLSAIYGAGPLAIDFRALGERARAVPLLAAHIEPFRAKRTSGRTHQTHSVGGWIGAAEYSGALDEFVPYLRAARDTGIGRHTAWGNGEIHVEILE